MKVPSLVSFLLVIDQMPQMMYYSVYNLDMYHVLSIFNVMVEYF